MIKTTTLIFTIIMSKIYYYFVCFIVLSKIFYGTVLYSSVNYAENFYMVQPINFILMMTINLCLLHYNLHVSTNYKNMFKAKINYKV